LKRGAQGRSPTPSAAAETGSSKGAASRPVYDARTVRSGRMARGASMPTEQVQLRIGIVGTGLIGQVHAAAVRTLPEATLTAVCDPITGKASAFTIEHAPGAVPFEDLTAMLDANLVDAVCVCTPHPQHAPVVEAAAARGVHAIVEKPFTATLADADR